MDLGTRIVKFLLEERVRHGDAICSETAGQLLEEFNRAAEVVSVASVIQPPADLVDPSDN